MVISGLKSNILVYTRGLVGDRSRSLRCGKFSSTTAPRARDSNAAWAARHHPVPGCYRPEIIPFSPNLGLPHLEAHPHRARYPYHRLFHPAA